MDENKICDVPSYHCLSNLSKFKLPKGFKKQIYLVFPVYEMVFIILKLGWKFPNVSLLNCCSTKCNHSSVTGSQDMSRTHVLHKIIPHWSLSPYFIMKETMAQVKGHHESQYGDTSSEWIICFVFTLLVYVLVGLEEILK